MAANTHNTRQKLDRRERMRIALDLRKQGHTYEQIAADKRINYASRGDAYKLVQDAIKEITREAAQDVLTLELERLDVLLLAMMPLAMKGDEKAVLRVLNVMDRRARYLGLDKAQAPDTSADARQALTDLMGLLTAAATPAAPAPAEEDETS